jgi:hypothetical protein
MIPLEGIDSVQSVLYPETKTFLLSLKVFLNLVRNYDVVRNSCCRKKVSCCWKKIVP